MICIIWELVALISQLAEYICSLVNEMFPNLQCRCTEKISMKISVLSLHASCHHWQVYEDFPEWISRKWEDAEDD